MRDQQMTLETNARQEKYIKSQDQKGGIGLVFADAFLRGMRDIGYKDPAWAACDLIDNSIQAQASVVEIVFGDIVSERGGEQPRQIAIVDNGVGMIPEMISYAVRWGGTDRENDRHGFGRYGYGLPSASVSMAKRYSVYSKHKGGSWHRVTVDLEKLAEIAGDLTQVNTLLQPVEAAPPEWVMKSAKHAKPLNAQSATVVLLEDLDRLRDLSGWRQLKSLKSKFSEHIGLIYRHWIPDTQIFVDGEDVQAVDPLFLMENGRYFDETEIMATAIETRGMKVKSSRGVEANIQIRASYLHPKFQWADTNVKPAGKTGTNRRHSIMRAYNGLHICRDGREIDCIQPPTDWTRFQTYDRNVKIEIDFDPELDGFFGITTAKQQITIRDDMWDRLQNRGMLKALISDIRKQLRGDINKLKTEEKKAKSEKERASERAMRESESLKANRKSISEKKQEKSQRNLNRRVSQEAEAKGKPVDEVANEIETETRERPFVVDFDRVPEGPMYRSERLGVQKRLILNTDHPFYERVYEQTPSARPAIEILLFALADGELDAEDQFEQFYQSARQNWSERVRHALQCLSPDESMRDEEAADLEAEESNLAAV